MGGGQDLCGIPKEIYVQSCARSSMVKVHCSLVESIQVSRKLRFASNI